MYSSSLVPGEVETRGNTQYVGKPLPKCKPSASRHDATSEKMEKCDPKNCMRVNSKVTCQIIRQVLDFCVYL